MALLVEGQNTIDTRFIRCLLKLSAIIAEYRPERLDQFTKTSSAWRMCRGTRSPPGCRNKLSKDRSDAFIEIRPRISAQLLKNTNMLTII